MRRVILLLILIIFSCSSSKYFNAFNGLKNKPKLLKITEFRVVYENDSIFNKVREGQEVYHFDKKGKIKSHIYYNSNGKQQNGGTKYIYDKKGNLINIKYFLLDSTLQVEYRNIYGNDNLLKRREIVYADSKKFTNFRYDKKNKKTIITAYDYKGEITNISHKKFNKGRENELIFMNELGETSSVIKKLYNSFGNNIKNDWYDSNNKLKSFTLFFTINIIRK